MSVMKLLLVEDDYDLAGALGAALVQRGYEVLRSASGHEALSLMRKRSFDAVVLDLSLPELDGLEVLQRIRDDGNRTPILVLTARSAVEERVKGLQSGADDYLSKPFDLDELVARLQALMRRMGRDGELRCGLVRWDAVSRSFYCQAVPLELSQRESELLRALMASVDRVVGKEALRAAVFGDKDSVSADAIEVLVHRLRKKLETTRVELLTLRGVGYMLCDDAMAAAPRGGR
jgi:DNA-binding response OmpR family regulator